MKLRRALATAAATAVIAPAALLAAPAAYAEDPAPETSETATTEPAPDTSETATTEPTSDTSQTATTEPTSSASETATTEPTSSTSAEPTADPSDDPSDGSFDCSEDGDEPQVDNNLVTSFSGLPSKIVAGSGFHAFKLNVTNKSDSAYKRVDLGVFAAQIDEDDWEVNTGHLTLQYQDPDSGAWRNISLDENDEGAGYVGYTDVAAHTTYSVNLRLSVDASAPAGMGFAVSIGIYANDEGDCVYSGGDSYYEFDVLAAGSKPGHVPGAKPQEGGKKPLPAKPAGNTEINPKGHLAETGSSSALPTIATIGGVAMALGAGAVFVVRRRKAASAEVA